MSGFFDVDNSADPGRLIRILDDAAVGLAAMKSYITVTHALRRPHGPVLSVGCGAGHDLALLAEAGMVPVGVDSSHIMMAAAASRSEAPLVCGRRRGAPVPRRRVRRVLD